MAYNVAVVGATGAVGNEILQILHERRFPIDQVVALASAGSAGKEVSFGEERTLRVRDLDRFDFEGVNLALFSPGAKVSAVHAPRAAAAGCVVIDNTSQFRMDEDVPLIVPEVNREALEGFRQRNIIANPNCSTIQMVVALKPLHDIARIRRVVVSTYQSVSGGGKEAMDELFEHTKLIYMNEQRNPEVFPKPIPFNVIPQIDVFLEDGSTKEEWKMVVETKKILDPLIEVSATCVRVPVFVGHSEAVTVEFEEPLSPRRRVRPCSRPKGSSSSTTRARGIRHPQGLRGRVRGLRLAHPQGPDRALWHLDVGRVRQSPQGGGPQCGADRRGHGRGWVPLNGITRRCG